MPFARIKLPLQVVRNFMRWHKINEGNAAIDHWVGDQMTAAMNPANAVEHVCDDVQTFIADLTVTYTDLTPNSFTP